MTEEEAKTKWCCAAHNHPTESVKCFASACMAWRQANEVAREKTCGHPWPCACASIRLHAALTKAKEAGK